MDEILDAYRAVFDAKGQMKVCGREACRRLIEAADRIEPGIFHGNPVSGFVDTDAVKRLISKL